MNCTLRRTSFEDYGVFGALLSDSGEVLAATLEHSYERKPKLPAGVYVCKRGTHQLHTNPQPFEAFEIMNVPGHTGILLHIGNLNKHSEGCVLLGLRREGPMVLGSKLAFDAFMQKQARVQEFTLTVLDS